LRQTIEDEIPEILQQETKPGWDGATGEYKGMKRWQKRKTGMNLILQVMRFGMVGGLNTALDLLIFNAFLLLFPTKDTFMLLVYNSTAYALGGINSFILNKYRTFRHNQKTTRQEVLRFIVTTLLGIACNDLIIWLISFVSHPLIADARLWANVSKICAIFGTVLISYVGMRLWVFVKPAQTTPGE